VNTVRIVWLWQVTGRGQWRGVSASFGQAQQDAQECMDNGGTSAVVESAWWALNPTTMQREYEPTGRRSTARRTGGHIEWTELGSAIARSA
jgi:hypothetical protein